MIVHMERNAIPTSVYLIANRDGVVIYVGMTANMNARMSQHKRSSVWASDAYVVQSTEYATRKMASAVEQMMIERYRTTIHNDAYEAIFAPSAGCARSVAMKIVECVGSIDEVTQRYGRVQFDRFFDSASL